MGDSSEETETGRDRKENILRSMPGSEVMPLGQKGLETARGRGRSSLPACQGADRRGTV